jgi:HK97 family phage portal protein
MPRPRQTWNPLKAAFASLRTLFSGYGGQGGRGWRLLSPGSQYDYEAEAGDLWRNSSVAACLRVIRSNITEPDFTVAVKDQAGNPEPILHPLLELWDQPNAYYGPAEMLAALALSVVVDGNGYLVKVRSAAGKVIELWWVPHWTMEARYPSDGSVYLSHYVYKINGKEIALRVEDVIHFRLGIDPRNDRMGLSDLKQGVREICSDNEAAGYASATLRNMGVPTVVITPAEVGGRFGDGQPGEIRREWRERFTGDRRGDPLVTDSLTVTKLSFTPKEMSLADLPDRFEDRICSLTGVNPMVAGLTSGGSHKTFANYAEARRAFYEDTLIPLLKAMARTLTQQLLSDFPAPAGAYVRWCFKSVQALREDANAVAERAGLLYQDKRVLTLNEARRSMGEPEVPGGDKFADGSTPEEGPSKPAPPMAPGGDPNAEPEPDPQAKSLRAEALDVLRMARERMQA